MRTKLFLGLFLIALFMGETFAAKFPLVTAAEKGKTETVQALLKSGSDIEEKDISDSTPLIQAARKGHLNVVKLLLEKGANINAQNIFGDTALMYAAASDHSETVKFLLEKGANPNLKNDSKKTALMSALDRDHAGVAQVFLDKGFATPQKLLLSSIKKGRTKVAAMLLEHYKNLDINKVTNGKTPLMLASKNGHIDLVKMLISKGADINIKGRLGKTAIELAHSNNHTDIEKLLLENNAQINKSYRFIKSTLMGALYYTLFIAFINWLLRPLVPNAVKEMTPPLPWPIKSKRKFFHDAYVYLIFMMIKMPILFFVTLFGLWFRILVFPILKLTNFLGVRHFNKKLSTKGPEYFEKNLKMYGNPKGILNGTTDKKGRTPLFFAIEKGRHDVIELFIANGADIHQKDKEGMTPLDFAHKKNQTEAIKILEKHLKAK